jgi:uncharacterized protein
MAGMAIEEGKYEIAHAYLTGRSRKRRIRRPTRVGRGASACDGSPSSNGRFRARTPWRGHARAFVFGSARGARLARTTSRPGTEIKTGGTPRRDRTKPLLIYLPIADLPVNIFLLLAVGLAVGFISGMFGVGGGFLMTPFLIFLGITPGVAVASVASHITASSFSGALSYWRRHTVDIQMAAVLLSGGLLGTASGVWVFTTLRALGQVDLLVGFSYLIMLTAVGGLMLVESIRTIRRKRMNKPSVLRRPGSHTWAHGLPLKLRFKKSRIYVSVIPVIGIGYAIGLVGAVMGIGGGFLLVPMLIYFLRMPTATVIGTAAVLTTATMAVATIMHGLTNHLVDAILALVLMVGGVVGAQFGARASQNMPAEQLRLLLGLLIVAVGCRFGYGLIVHPKNLYSVQVPGADL